MGNQSADPQIYECAVGVLQAPWMVQPMDRTPLRKFTLRKFTLRWEMHITAISSQPVSRSVSA